MTPPRKPKLSYAICMSPMFGNALHKNLIEWFEYNLMMGTQHFYAYDVDQRDKNPETMKILNYYRQKGLVTILDWKPSLNHFGWYSHQLVANHDCLYRYRDQWDWIQFNDVDEYLFSLKNLTVQEILTDWRKRDDYDSIAAVNIKSRFFRIADEHFWRPNSTLVSQTWTARSIVEEAMFNCYKAKNLIRPKLVINFYNVHCVGGIKFNKKAWEIDVEEFRNNHYWNHEWWKIPPLIIDNSMWKYGEQLLWRVQQVDKDLKEADLKL